MKTSWILTFCLSVVFALTCARGAPTDEGVDCTEVARRPFNSPHVVPNGNKTKLYHSHRVERRLCRPTQAHLKTLSRASKRKIPELTTIERETLMALLALLAVQTVHPHAGDLVPILHAVLNADARNQDLRIWNERRTRFLRWFRTTGPGQVTTQFRQRVERRLRQMSAVIARLITARSAASASTCRVQVNRRRTSRQIIVGQGGLTDRPVQLDQVERQWSNANLRYMYNVCNRWWALARTSGRLEHAAECLQECNDMLRLMTEDGCQGGWKQETYDRMEGCYQLYISKA